MVELLATPFMANLGGGLGQSLGRGLGGAVGGSPAGPSHAEAAVYGSGLDASGWAVNFSGIQSASSGQDKSGGVPGVGLSGIGAGVPGWAWIAVGGLVLWKLYRSRR